MTRLTDDHKAFHIDKIGSEYLSRILSKNNKLITENEKLQCEVAQMRQELVRSYEALKESKDLIRRLLDTSVDMATKQATHDHLMARRDAVEFIK